MINNTSVDSYLRDGCGRCDKFQTPQCKVHRWTEPLIAIRQLLRETELEETMKWGSPCYALDGQNLIMIVSTVRFCAISFFKGAAFDDPGDDLVPPGPNSRHARYLRFESLDDVNERLDVIDNMIGQAIAAHRSGLQVEYDPLPEPMPDELDEHLAANESLQRAFDALTPGRQRSYILYVGGAKKTETRVSRAARCDAKIFAGKGYNER